MCNISVQEMEIDSIEYTLSNVVPSCKCAAKSGFLGWLFRSISLGMICVKQLGQMSLFLKLIIGF